VFLYNRIMNTTNRTDIIRRRIDALYASLPRYEGTPMWHFVQEQIDELNRAALAG
jgi:hypothetical protein